MTKAEKIQFEAYKKSNNTRKKLLLAKWGYKTHEAYLTAIKVPVYKLKTSKGKTTTPIPVKVTKIKAGTKTDKSTDYVIAFDTTGSMSGYIAEVKKHVVKLVNDLFDKSNDLQISIVAFGDYCDAPNDGSNYDNLGKAYQVIGLTTDRKALVDFVNKAQNTGGGDEDEFYELVIRKINLDTDWRVGNRAVLLIGDAATHPVGYKYGQTTHHIDWRKEAANAKVLGIQYDTLMINNDRWYEELSDITGGVSMKFKNVEKISNIVEGAIYARSSTSAFKASYTSAVASGDSELIGAYKSMSTLLED